MIIQDASKRIDNAYLKTGLSEKTLTQDMYNKNTRIKTLSAYEHDTNFETDDKDFAYDDLS